MINGKSQASMALCLRYGGGTLTSILLQIY